MAAAKAIGPSEVLALGVPFDDPVPPCSFALAFSLSACSSTVLPLLAAPLALALLLVCDLERLFDFRPTLPVVVMIVPKARAATNSLALVKANTAPIASEASALASPLPSVLM